MRATLYTADWVLPVTAPPIAYGSVLVDDKGMIRAVGPRDAVAAGDDVYVHALGAALLLPGLINAHAHPELTAMRGLLEDLPFHQWIPSLRRAKSAASAGDRADAARLTCAEALAAGITTIAATEDSAAAVTALRETGMRGIVYREVFGPVPAAAHEQLAVLIRGVDEMRRSSTDMVHIGVSPHAPYTVSDELFRLVADYAAAEQLPVAVHIAESEVESQLVADGAGPFAAGLRTRGIDTPARARSPVQLLANTRVLACRPVLIHCVRVDRDDLRLIADAGAGVAHCPVANARLGHGIAPVLEMLAESIVVGLGSDSVAANNRVDILEEARIAQLMQRARARSAGALNAHALLRMATLDGARLLQLDSRIGSLETGKDADLCAVSLETPHATPVNDPVTTLFMSARAPDVVLTVVRGSVLYEKGRFTGIDAASLRERLQDSAARMRAALRS